MPDVSIKVKNKIAVGDGTVIICGNTDYTAVFDFDAEWDEYETKTARFISNGEYTDVVFIGDRCAIPAQQNTHGVQVGVFAGDLHTTTPAYFDCAKSILCDGGAPADPAQDVYGQLMEKLNGLEGVSAGQLAEAVNEYLAENPVDVPVQSVNGKTGAVELTASDVGTLAGGWVYYWGKPPFSGLENNAIVAILRDCRYGIVATQDTGEPDGMVMPAFVIVGSSWRWLRYFSVIDAAGKYYTGKWDMREGGTLTCELQTVDRSPTTAVITYDEDTDSYSADKTFEEIKAAYDAGQVVQADYDGALFALNTVAEDMATFGATYSADGASLQWDTIMLSADGSIYFDTVEGIGTDISNGITGASVGQTIKVKAVDDDGKPTEWEAADMPEEGVWAHTTYDVPEGTTGIKLSLPDKAIRKATLYLRLYTSSGKPAIRLYGDVQATSGNASKILCDFENFYTSAQEQRQAVITLETWNEDKWRILYTDAASSFLKFSVKDRISDFLYLVCLTDDVTIKGEAELYYVA